jgi:hypothetical protein
VQPKIFLYCKTKFLEMTKEYLGLTSASKASTHKDNRENTELIRLRERVKQAENELRDLEEAVRKMRGD